MAKKVTKKKARTKKQTLVTRMEAIEYLQENGDIRQNEKVISSKPVVKHKKDVYYQQPKFTKEEEAKIAKVMGEGIKREAKVYGDPIVQVFS